LAREYEFARRLVNSGRLSVPATLNTSTLNTPDCDHFEGTLAPGAPALDAPMLDEPHWLLRCLAGNGFHALIFDGPQTNAIIQIIESAFQDLPGPQIGTHQTTAPPLNLPVNIVIVPCKGLAAKRYDASPGTTYLLRPDQHVCARWREPSAALVRAALRRALAVERSQ
jgi:3-(3-hydroxy-phenyl)propionate hydroxylase